MYSGLIGKIEKAKWYAQDPSRVTLLKFTILFHGDHSDHVLTFDNGLWHCECAFYASHLTCSHTMAVETQLGEMLPEGLPAPS